MPLPNPRLEQLHSELCAILTERQGERIRTQKTDSAGIQLLDQASADIRSWTEDASRIGADPENEEQLFELVERARAISLKLSTD
ncbi:hypothetical protein KUV26_22200 [Leisingera daeponensis]|uniref:Uncharacterized protein n=1 Tax=Leisingera daeponensis TaxID=405746 RepID=A0ABS7NLS9_9RHOB|nr:hypothetical protein [Leisingera daeponensis]MBY6142153.1 hypothetical protein [Leisingera daeponensis]